MTIMLFERPTADASLLPPTSHAVANRMCAFAASIGGLFDPMAEMRDPLLKGGIVMPFANTLIAGTACRRPLLFREGEVIVDETGIDLILLRHDRDKGVTFDVRHSQRTDWLCHYVAWRAEGDLWLIPEVGEVRAIRVLPWGLDIEEGVPFGDAAERRQGILRDFTAPILGRRI